MMKNIQHPTTNIQQPTPTRLGLSGCSLWDVRCGMFPLMILLLLITRPLHGQTGAADKSGPLKLLPPYGELPPTFVEQHASSMILVGLAAIVVMALVLWLIGRSQSKNIISPEEQVRQALASLRQQPEDGAILSRVSQVVRHYFIAAFQLPAGEFTTAEFGRLLSGRDQIGAELAVTAIDFLRACDAQKFSSATASVPIKAVDQALNLIERAEQRRAQLRPLAATSTQGRRA